MTMSPLRPSARINAVTAYRPPRHGAPIDLHLDGNEGDVPDGSVLAVLGGKLPDVLRRYPSATELQNLIAAKHGVPPDRVIITAGGDESIDRLCRTFLDQGSEVILPVPTFVMVERYAKLAGATIRLVEWPGGAYPTDDVIRAITPETRMISVVTPNNPTGAVATADDLRRLSQAAPHALIMVDLAYSEFADVDLTQVALELPNAVAIRTISKAYGMAGLRIGYALGSTEVIAWMRVAGGPYSVSGPSLAIAANRLGEETSALQEYVGEVCREREELTHLLHGMGIDVPPSQGNFIAPIFTDEVWVRDGLAGLGIAVRIFPGDERMTHRARITIPGRRDEFVRLENALKATLAPEAVIFDMDGVIADVSESYRRAIVETARTWGVEVSREDVFQMKAAGSANNDWEVTQRLLERAGIDASLDEVTARFEHLYQGTEENPGLRSTEKLLTTRALIERIGQRYRLAIVTGRPRLDAERFLRENGLDGLFETLVCMEDAKWKPDPAPVLLALERMAVRFAWMIGDTRDDVTAARAAGVVPLAIVAPGDDPERTSPILTKAGAARVLRTLSELEELLP